MGVVAVILNIRSAISLHDKIDAAGFLKEELQSLSLPEHII